MKILYTLFFLAANAVAIGQTIINSTDRPIAIVDVSVIPMDREVVLSHQTVIIKNGKVDQMGHVKTLRPAKDALLIDGKGKYLIPGLAEMHAHVPPMDDINQMKDVLSLFLANGITTIRGMLGHPRHLELRTKLQSGEILGPQLFTTGPSFSGYSVTSPDEGARMVRKQKEMGYDFLKLHPGLSRQKFDSIAAAAHKVGIPFVGHVSFGVGIWRAIDAGYSSIDHLDGFVEGLVPGIEQMVEQQAGLFGMFVADRADESQVQKMMEGLRKQKVWVVPTQALAERWFAPAYNPANFSADPNAVYVQPEVRKQWIESKENLMKNPQYDAKKIEDFIALRRRLILACQKSGVGLLLGCDAPQIFNVPGFSTHQELQYLVKAGLTPFQALKTGTSNVAVYLNKPNEGTIKEGNIANLVLLNGNPLNKIEHTQEIAGVMKSGQWLSREYLDNVLETLKK